MEKIQQILEINLISAQDLKPPSSNLRRMQTYAVVYVDPSTKLRTRIDKIGSQNPSWNDKFLFKVSKDFLSRETSSVSFEIYAVGRLKDSLIGTVRFLINNVPILSSVKRTPSVIALQVRRPSGRFQGVLNVAVAMNDRSLELLKGLSGIGYRDLMGGKVLRVKRSKNNEEKNKKSDTVESEESFCGCDLEEFTSDGEESTSSSNTASSSSATSSVLRDWNSVREMAGKGIGSDGRGLFCGLLNQRRYSLCFSDLNPRRSEKEN